MITSTSRTTSFALRFSMTYSLLFSPRVRLQRSGQGEKTRSAVNRYYYLGPEIGPLAAFGKQSP
jgi:hypothetical protein